MYIGIRLLLLFIPLFLHFFFLSNFQTLKCFVTLFLGTVRPRRLNPVHTWTVGRCTVFIGIKLLLLIRPFISSFFFLSNFQILKFFVTFFSGTMRHRRLKLDSHVDSGQMYRVYRIRLLLLIRPFISSCFFLSNFQAIKLFFVTLVSGIVRPSRLKLGAHVDSGQAYCVYRNQDAAAYSFLYFFIFLSLPFSNIKIFRQDFSQEL